MAIEKDSLYDRLHVIIKIIFMCFSKATRKYLVQAIHLSDVLTCRTSFNHLNKPVSYCCHCADRDDGCGGDDDGDEDDEQIKELKHRIKNISLLSNKIRTEYDSNIIPNILKLQ